MAIKDAYLDDTTARSTKGDVGEPPTAEFDPDMPHDACDQDDEDEAGNP